MNQLPISESSVQLEFHETETLVEDNRIGERRATRNMSQQIVNERSEPAGLILKGTFQEPSEAQSVKSPRHDEEANSPIHSLHSSSNMSDSTMTVSSSDFREGGFRGLIKHIAKTFYQTELEQKKVQTLIPEATLNALYLLKINQVRIWLISCILPVAVNCVTIWFRTEDIPHIA